MAVLDETRYGCQSQTATLRRVLVRAPRAEDGARWREFGWRAEPDPARLAAEHEGFAAELTEFGAALVFPPLAPTRLLQLLAERGVATVEVPVEEYDSLGCNVLALGPRVALALDGNPETRRRLEAAGVDVRVYRGEELSLKGDGGPTCLTRPLLRDDA